MQLHLDLVTFQYENSKNIRTIQINGEPWFSGADVCAALEISNVGNAYGRLDKDDIRTTDVIDTIGRKQKTYIISEYGLYDLILQSRKDEARRFKRWITHEVIPQIRRTGAFSLAPKNTPLFVRRFNDNWDRVERGYFSVISELYIRVHGKFEQAGHTIADHAPDGTELRPDVSVGRTFPKWLEKSYPEYKRSWKTYSHLLPGGIEVQARQYSTQVLPAFIEFIEDIWLKEYATDYLEKRDVKALQYLPKLLPPPKAATKPPRAKLDFSALKKSIG